MLLDNTLDRSTVAKLRSEQTCDIHRITKIQVSAKVSSVRDPIRSIHVRTVGKSIVELLLGRQ